MSPVITNLPVVLEPMQTLTFEQVMYMFKDCGDMGLNLYPNHAKNMSINDCLIGLYMSGYKWTDDASGSKTIYSDLNNPLAVFSATALTIRFTESLDCYSVEGKADILACLLCFSPQFTVCFEDSFIGIKQVVQSLGKSLADYPVKSDYLVRIERDFQERVNPFLQRKA